MNFGKSIGSVSGKIIVILAGIISLNFLASKINLRADLTEGDIYSVSDGTVKILQDLDSDIQVKFFFSRSLPNLPVVLKTYASRVEEVLGEYEDISSGKVSVSVVDPEPDTVEDEEARKYGLNPISLGNGPEMFFGVVMFRGTKEVVIPYLDPRREEFLEYDLSESLVKLSKDTQTKIGVMSSLPVFGGGASPHGQPAGQSWFLIEDLKKNYEIKKVEVTATEISKDLDLLIILHPKNLSESTQFAIDQFVVKGGKLILAVDPFSRTDLASSGGGMPMGGQMPQTASDLNKLLKGWGIEYDSSKLVGDLRGATPISPGNGQQVVYPFFINLSDVNFSNESVISNQLRQIMIAEGGSISLAEGSKLQMESLLSTNEESGTINGMMAAFSPVDSLASQFKPDGKVRTIAALFKGTFDSTFAEAPVAKEGEGVQSSHVAKAEQESVVMVVADVDFLHDSNSVRVISMFNQRIPQLLNDNLSFMKNSVDLLAGSSELISIRSRGKIARPFTVVQELQLEAQKKWKDEEEKLNKRLADVQQKLSALQQQRTDGARLTLSADQEAEIRQFREEEQEVRKRRREVRRNLREDIEGLGNKLIMANMVGVPFLVSVFGFFVFRRRTRRTARGE